MYVPGMTSRKLSVTLLGAALALSACSGAEGSTSLSVPLEVPVESAEDISPAPQGPASGPADFGGGLTARIVSATSSPTEGTGREGEGDTLVQITVEISNDGDSDFEFPAAKMYVGEYLTYGANGYEANGWVTDSGGSTELPERLVPGSSATTVSDHTLPAEGLEELTFHFNPNSEYLTEWVFTDVEDEIEGP